MSAEEEGPTTTCSEIVCASAMDCMGFGDSAAAEIVKAKKLTCGQCESQEEADKRAGQEKAARKCKEKGGKKANQHTPSQDVGLARPVPPSGWEGVSIRAEMNEQVFLRGDYTQDDHLSNKKPRTFRYAAPLPTNAPQAVRPLSPPQQRDWNARANLMLRKIREEVPVIRTMLKERWRWTRGHAAENLAEMLNKSELGHKRARVDKGDNEYVLLDPRPWAGKGSTADWLDRIINAVDESNMIIGDIHLHFHTNWNESGPVLTIYLKGPPDDPRLGRPIPLSIAAKRGGGRRKTRRKRRRGRNASRKRRRRKRKTKRRKTRKRRTRRRKR